MNIIQKYVFALYVRLFALTFFGIIIMLYLMRLKEIFRYISIGTSLAQTIYLILWQLPLIIPFSVCIACAVASYSAVKISISNGEFLLPSSSGVPPFSQWYPCFVFSAILCPLCLIFSSSLTPIAKQKAISLLATVCSSNPLSAIATLPQKSILLVNTPPKPSTQYSNGIIVYAPKKLNMPILLFPKIISLTTEGMQWENSTIIHYDVENVASLQIDEESLFFPGDAINNLVGVEGLQSKISTQTSETILETTNLSNRGWNIILSRVFISIVPLLLALLGFSCGIDTRRETKNGITAVLALLCFFTLLSPLLIRSSDIHPIQSLSFLFAVCLTTLSVSYARLLHFLEGKL